MSGVVCIGLTPRLNIYGMEHEGRRYSLLVRSIGISGWNAQQLEHRYLGQPKQASLFGTIEALARPQDVRGVVT